MIGGTPSVLSDFTKVLADEGYEPIKLGVSGAHTRLMAEGVQLMRDSAGQPFTPPAYDVLMNVTAGRNGAGQHQREPLPASDADGEMGRFHGQIHPSSRPAAVPGDEQQTLSGTDAK